jgi:hypothetical protein
MSKVKRNKPVIVKWVDITSWTGWNDELIEQNLDEPTLLYTVGYIVRKTKDKLTITDTYPDTGAVVTFPIGCVISIIELEVKEDI